MRVINICKKHFKDNILIYSFLIIALMIGISSGAITISMINAEQKKELMKFLNSFLKIVSENDVDNMMLVKQSFKNNIQTFITLWFLGISIIGIPLIIGLVLLRGFIIGFTVGFIVKELGFKGFLFSVFSILPQNIVFIPWILISSAFALIFAISFIKSKISKSIKGNYINEVMVYTLIMSILFITSLFGTVIESYITPIFMKLIS